MKEKAKEWGDCIGSFMTVCLIDILAVAAWMDLRTNRISNHLIILGLLFGYISNIVKFGWLGNIYFFIRISVPVLLFYLFFLMHVLGAGDIKLFSVISSFIGLWGFSEVVAYSFLAGAAASIMVLIYHQNLFTRIQYFFQYIRSIFYQKCITKYDFESDGKRNYIHFSVAIFVGFSLFLLKH